jgi:hypothetical protein
MVEDRFGHCSMDPTRSTSTGLRPEYEYDSTPDPLALGAARSVPCPRADTLSPGRYLSPGEILSAGDVGSRTYRGKEGDKYRVDTE